MMRIIPLEIEIDYWRLGKKNYHTLRLAIMHFDLPDSDASLFEIGWYQGGFVWDLFYMDLVMRKVEQWRSRKG
jgi:hypothetical protein